MDENFKVFSRIAEIDKLLSKNNLEEKKLKEERAVLEKQGLDIMSTTGIDRLTINNRTLYLNPTVIALPLVDKHLVAKALIEAGYADIVKTDYNSRSLNSLAKEWLENNERETDDPLVDDLNSQVPESLREFLSITTIDRISSRKS